MKENLRLKICTKCGEAKLLDDFPKSKRHRQGVSNPCKACKLIQTNTWRNRNKDYVNSLSRVRSKKLEYKRNARNRIRNWKIKHPERNRMDGWIYYLNLQLAGKGLTSEQWQQIKEFYQFTCAYCGCEPTQLVKSHVIPLSKGGDHIAPNIVPACIKCASGRHDENAIQPKQNHPIGLVTTLIGSSWKFKE